MCCEDPRGELGTAQTRLLDFQQNAFKDNMALPWEFVISKPCWSEALNLKKKKKRKKEKIKTGTPLQITKISSRDNPVVPPRPPGYLFLWAARGCAGTWYAEARECWCGLFTTRQTETVDAQVGAGRPGVCKCDFPAGSLAKTYLFFFC